MTASQGLPLPCKHDNRSKTHRLLLCPTKNTDIFENFCYIESEEIDEEVIRDYAKETFCPEQFIVDRRGKNLRCARSFLGIPVITTKGNLWGVVVLDSMRPDGITKKASDPMYKTMTDELPHLVEMV